MNRMHLFLARRYAQAFLNVFYDTLQIEDIISFEKTMLFFKTHEHACFLMDLTLLSQHSKEHALDGILKKFSLPPSCRILFTRVLEQKRAALLGDIFDQIIVLYKKRAGIVTFKISSSLSLSADEKGKVEDFLKRQVKATVICSYEIDTTLIAGIRISNEFFLWDHTVKARLRSLQNCVRH